MWRITTPDLAIDLSSVLVNGVPISEMDELQVRRLAVELGIKSGPTVLYRNADGSLVKADQRWQIAALFFAQHVRRLLVGEQETIIKRPFDVAA